MMDIETGQGAGLKLWTSLSLSRNGPNRYTTFSFNGKYSCTSWLSATASVPFRTIFTERITTAGTDKYELSGMGDVSAFGFADLTVLLGTEAAPDIMPKIDIFERERLPFDEELLAKPETVPRTGPHVSVGLGLIFPTGEDDARDEYGYFPPEAQLGSGTFNTLVGVSCYQKFGYFIPYASFFYQFTGGKNDAGLDRGDKLIWSIGTNYNAAAVIKLVLTAEISGMTSVRDDRQNRVRVPDSHGSLMFFSPGAKIRLYGTWELKLKCLFPLWKNTDSSENDLDFSVSVSIYYSF